MQQFLNLQELPQALAGRKVMLVCGGSMDRLSIGSAVTKLAAVRFSGFSPNPLYEDVAAGVKQFLETGCDAILAVGGGSAMDVAKCIKLFATMDQGKLYLGQPYEENDILLAAKVFYRLVEDIEAVIPVQLIHEFFIILGRADLI